MNQLNRFSSKNSQNKMNIGIVTTWFERGASQVSRQYRDLLNKKNNVFIYARGGEKYERNNPIWDTQDVTWGKKAYFQTNGTPIKRSHFKNWIDKNKIDVLFFNEQQWWIPVIWAKEWGIKIGSYIDYYTKDTVPFFEIFDFLICNTKRHYSAFEWHKNCHYVKWGTDTSLFSPNENSSKNEKIVFFNSAGHNPDRKGVRELIEAFHSINNDFAELLIHTQVDILKFYPDLKEKIIKLKNQKKLKIIQKTVSAPGLYHMGDVYCYISKLDGIGLTVPEALSCGLPVITPDHPPMNEFVKENINGKLVDVVDTYFREDGYFWPQLKIDNNSLITALEYYISEKNNILQFKIAAREYAKANLNWKDRLNEINDIFHNVKTDNSKKIIGDIRLYERKNFLKNFHQLPRTMVKTLLR